MTVRTLPVGLMALFVVLSATAFGTVYFALAPTTSTARAASATEFDLATPDLATAVASYRAGDYADAMDGFAALARSEPDARRRAVLHANAGTAAARAEQLGEAVWHLLRARRLDPGDATAESNLARVRALVGGGPTEASHFTETLAALPLLHTEAHLVAWAFRIAGLGLLVAAFWRLWPGRRGLAWLAALLLALPPAGIAWSRHARAQAGREAVIIEKVVPVRSEPQDDGKILLRVGGGAVVVHEEDRGDWRLIETTEGGRGWVRAERIRLIGE